MAGMFSRFSDRIKAIAASLASVDDRLARLERRLDVMEHFSHGSRATYVGANRVLVKCVVAEQQVAFLVEADDRLLSPWFIVSGGYETELTNYLVHALKPDSHCLDVGANFGYFSCLMARFCPTGRVIGVEADRHVYELARDNVFINGFNDRAEIVWAAASDSEREVTLYRRSTRSANTSIAKLPADFIERMGEPESVPFVVPGLRLDSLAARLGGRVDFIKIDVEGGEPLALRGARAIIADNPQLRILMEWSPGQMKAAGADPAAFLDELDQLGLKAYNIVAPARPEDEGLAAVAYSELIDLPYCAGVVLKRDAPAA